jgi:lactoylglutathione lyase
MTGETNLHHVNVLVDILEEGVAFFRDIVGLELIDTPDQNFPSQFFALSNGTQIHMNELEDERPYRAHFCITVDDFSGLFRRMKAAGAIDIEPWGKIRRLPSGAMQMFCRDPSGNLIEVASRPGEPVDTGLLDDEFADVSNDNSLFKAVSEK